MSNDMTIAIKLPSLAPLLKVSIAGMPWASALFWIMKTGLPATYFVGHLPGVRALRPRRPPAPEPTLRPSAGFILTLLL
ncbi:MAG: hypothetical protein ACREP3_13845 [Candidatus Binatia bacterium]